MPGGASPLLPIPSWFRKSGYTDGVYRGDDSLGGGIASAQTVDILAQTVNLANMRRIGGGIMPASYETGGGLSGGAGGLHSGGGYTVLGGSGGAGGGLAGISAADLDAMRRRATSPTLQRAVPRSFATML